MTSDELKAIRADIHERGDRNDAVGHEVGLRLLDEVERLRTERAELRKLAKDVRDFWRDHPGFTHDGISTPGMLLLMAVER